MYTTLPTERGMSKQLDKLSSGVAIPFTPLIYHVYVCSVKLLTIQDPFKAMLVGAIYKAKCKAFMEEHKRERERQKSVHRLAEMVGYEPKGTTELLEV